MEKSIGTCAKTVKRAAQKRYETFSRTVRDFLKDGKGLAEKRYKTNQKTVRDSRENGKGLARTRYIERLLTPPHFRNSARN